MEIDTGAYDGTSRKEAIPLEELGGVIQHFAPMLWQLLACLEVMDVGFEVWDGLGRSAFRNRAGTRLDGVDHFEKADGDVVQPDYMGAHLMRVQGDRWISVYEARIADGFKVELRIDVTELIEKVVQLEKENRSLLELSITDPLTGLANRRHCEELLATEWMRAARNNENLSLLMIDIDYFKRFNDNYGHLAGDDCLRKVANALKSSLRRAGEFVARYGGEEFILLMPGADEEEACAVAERCLDAMVEAAIPHVTSPVASMVTVSIGVACARADATQSALTLVDAADAAMYRAKSAGRACYRLATDVDWGIDKDTPRTVPAPL